MKTGSRFRTSRHARSRAIVATAGVAALIAASNAPAAPAAGESYVYTLMNGYSKEARGQLHYRVDKADSAGITVTVTPDHPAAGAARTEMYTREGNWLQHPVESHGSKIDYRFATAYPAYVFPLDAGKTWSLRVNANAPGESRARSVRVDGKVLGTERIRVPAGEFDAIKVQRLVYSGDPRFDQTETQVVETDWYVPALGRAVRTERRSRWEEPSRCGLSGPCIFNGDWDVYELVRAK